MKMKLFIVLLLYCWKVDGNNHTKRQIHYVARRQDPLSKGPVLFPSSSSPPPRTPLIVTSRPLADLISRSDLLHGTRPSYWQLGNEIGPEYEDDRRRTNSSGHPYAAVASKLKQLLRTEDARGYSRHEQQTVLPPIYKALGNFAKSKVLNKKYGKTKLTSQKKTKIPKSDGEDDDYYNDNFGNEAKQYAFSYSVRDQQTGDDFSHSQSHSGSATNGEYRVKLPDGRLQIVSYTADNGGYKAEVRYEDDTTGNQNELGRINVLSSEGLRRVEEPERYSTPIPNSERYIVSSTPTSNLERYVVSSTPIPNLERYSPKEERYSPKEERYSPKEESNTLGRIVVPSKEEADYEDYYYYDDRPREVLITSKPVYHHTTPSPFQDQRFGAEQGVRLAAPTTPSTYSAANRNLKAAQVRYTTVAPIAYSARPLQLVNYFEYRK